jgi:hypothetical protein
MRRTHVIRGLAVLVGLSAATSAAQVMDKKVAAAALR